VPFLESGERLGGPLVEPAGLLHVVAPLGELALDLLDRAVLEDVARRRRRAAFRSAPVFLLLSYGRSRPRRRARARRRGAAFLLRLGFDGRGRFLLERAARLLERPLFLIRGRRRQVLETGREALDEGVAHERERRRPELRVRVLHAAFDREHRGHRVAPGHVVGEHVERLVDQPGLECSTASP
jgi:hypothetical protein